MRFLGLLVLVFIGALALSPEFELSGWAIALAFSILVLLMKGAGK